MPTEALVAGMPEQKVLTLRLCLGILLLLFLLDFTMEAIVEFLTSFSG